jgi:hypothetical protein
MEEGESLEKFLSHIDEQLKRHPAIRTLIELRNNLFSLSKECKAMLEQESQTLWSWKGAVYDWGKRR